MEQVLVFRQADFDCERVAGLTKDMRLIHEWEKNIFLENNLFFMDREAAEQDETVKQIIPYIVVANMDNHILTYSRTKKGGENRLHSKFSVGFGGHINPIDNLEEDILRDSIRRELEEELILDDTLRNSIEESLFTTCPQALIYDNSNAVGRVHFGLVYVIDTDYTSPTVDTNDKSISTPTFYTLREIKTKLEEFENWSQLIIKSKILE